MKIPDMLYSQILQVMPIPCVDLLVVNDHDDILLVKRKNQPAQGQWWFPGGRIWLGEKRRAAAVRKLAEECRLNATGISYLGTFDLFLDRIDGDLISHSITSLYRVSVKNYRTLQLDSQSSEAIWMAGTDWLRESLHPFVEKQLAAYLLRDHHADNIANA